MQRPIADKFGGASGSLRRVQEREGHPWERKLWERSAAEGRSSTIRAHKRFGRAVPTPVRKSMANRKSHRIRNHAKVTWRAADSQARNSIQGSARPSLVQAYTEEARRLTLAQRYASGQAQKLADPGTAELNLSPGDTWWPYRSPPRVWKAQTHYSLHDAGALGGSYWGNAPAPPDAMLSQENRKLSIVNDLTGGPWYGNYVGPSAGGYYAGDPDAPPPLTPVDRAAWQHDYEYNRIYKAYGFDERAHPLGWFGNLTSLDPGFQLELAWADLKLIGRSWGYMFEGVFDGFYRSDKFAIGTGPLALGMDLAWAVGITATHAMMVATRLAMVGLGLIYHGMRLLNGGIMKLGNWIGGDVGKFVTGMGEFLDSLVVGFGQLAGFAVGAVGLLSIAAVGVVAIVAAVPIVIVGSIVGGLIDGFGDVVESVSDGCFITQAVLQSGSLELEEGDILDQLRDFRDEYVLSQPEGRRLVSIYYATAPEIVRSIDALPDRDEIWREVYQRWLRPAIEAVRHDEPVRALGLYDQMLTTLCAVTGVTMKTDSSRRHWKRDPMLAT